ncbi:MAG: carboxypeptidase-like regulatory domain-containing protein, partial [Gelidibacter sp.]|nr:carboxypeptidase-like regulatory domain-containing protein [Gelidibacter sp.]
MRLFISILIFSIASSVFAQNKINGKVKDVNGMPIMGANVYIEGTYDGSTTNELGEFSFGTDITGTQTLIVSYLSYETFTMTGDISLMKNLQIKLREDVNTLGAVVISAGTFSAGDNSKVNVLNALDVVTTASALGDFVGALQTLPGTTTVAEDGRLFVRGGEADETQI